ncbi:hypothetical protein D4R87_00105 [bacterium]|nr:MAG: hypothetical protein D4R87_00105 [bacterium]
MDKNTNWVHVESALNEGTVSGYKIAIIETEKIFVNILEEKGFYSRSHLRASAFRKAKHIFKNFRNIEHAFAMYDKILTHPGFTISKEDTKEIIKNFHDGISDLEKLNGDTKGIFGTFRRLNRKINSFYDGKIKKWLIVFASFCFLVLFLSKTPPGQTVASKTVLFVEFITFKIVVPVILVFLAFYVLVAGIKYFRRH